jgi:hypothetical protein
VHASTQPDKGKGLIVSETQTDNKARSYMLISTANYLTNKLGNDGQRIIDNLSPQTRSILTAEKPADWSPMHSYVELLNAVAAVGKGDDAKARDSLIDAGRYVAQEASTTFLKLFLKMLTPNLFVRKVPTVWQRDFTRGRAEAEISQNRLVFRMFGISEMDHIPCTAPGFISFAMESMGKSIRSVSVHNWSLQEPCRDGAYFELEWA